MTDEPMTEEKKAAIALAKARTFKDGSSDPFLAQMEWEEHLMKEQQKLNRRTVLFSVIISSILGMLGIIGGAFLQYHLERNREQSSQEIHQRTRTTSEYKTPPTTPRDASTTKELYSSKPPIKNEQKR